MFFFWSRHTHKKLTGRALDFMSLSINGFFETKAVNSLLKRVITNNPSPFSFPLEGEENIYKPAFVHSHACEVCILLCCRDGAICQGGKEIIRVQFVRLIVCLRQDLEENWFFLTGILGPFA